MIYIQILLVVFFLFALLKVIGRWRAKELTWSEALGWIVLWTGGIIVAAIPNSSAQVAKIFGIGRGVDLVIYVSLVLIFYFLFRLMTRIERIEKNITKISRKIALDEVEDKK